MPTENQTFSASVKVMRSYDYCHFEICLGSDEKLDKHAVNELRKDAQRLADEAVRQYAKAKEIHESALQFTHERTRIEREVDEIRKKAESEWTPYEKAEVKALEDYRHYEQVGYDYEDDDI
jgi:vacuolar-type H+-ATPase subunit I/STV1